MLSPAPDQAIFDGQSREFQLVCDPASTVLWLDERARRALHMEPGRRLSDVAAQGTEDKVERLFGLDGAQREEPWEVVLRLGQRT